MSETDSDLDYESADEDASYDTNVVNNNTSDYSEITDKVNKNATGVSYEKSSSLSCTEYTSETVNTGCGKLRNTEFQNIKMEKSDSIPALNENTSQLLEEQTNQTHKSDISSNVKDSDTLGVVNSDTVEVVKSDTAELVKSDTAELVKNDTAELVKSNSAELVNNDSNIEKICIKENEEKCEKTSDKQRVTLRLEKKLQQRNEASRTSIEQDIPELPILKNEQPQAKSSWGFSSWGSNLFSTAASSVTTFTSQVSQGIGTVIDTVESTLGVPPAEELAATLADKKESSDTKEVGVSEETVEAKVENNQESKLSMLPNISSWTKVLENTSSKVILGGLDTLELIGKKTINIITEGDPGLRKKRAAFSDGMYLSQILREAKEKADKLEEEQKDQNEETVSYSQVFDEFQGLVHLEALEMLSKQSQAKLGRLLMRVPRNAEIRTNMEEIKNICEDIPTLDDPSDCENFEDFQTIFTKHTLELNLPFDGESILKAHKRITDVVKNYEISSAVISTPEEIYHSAIYSLAEFAARSMETFHKLAELILVQSTYGSNYEKLATDLTGLTTVMCIEVNNLSTRYQHCLDKISEQSDRSSDKKLDITSIITNVFVEAANSNKYIQDAFLLLVPVLQSCLLESTN